MTQLLNTSKLLKKCSTKGCDNTTVTYFEGKKQKIFICDLCLQSLADKAISGRIPKSPQNTIKKILDRRGV